jgi:hypothetical protein
MPRELLLPIPHAIADRVHHTLTAAAEVWAEEAADSQTALQIARDFQSLAEKLDTLAREAGVIGW